MMEAEHAQLFELLLWVAGILLGAMGALTTAFWKHARNERCHVSNGMTRTEIVSELKALRLSDKLLAKALDDWRKDMADDRREFIDALNRVHARIDGLGKNR